VNPLPLLVPRNCSNPGAGLSPSRQILSGIDAKTR
jgi:hypothetical protein